MIPLSRNKYHRKKVVYDGIEFDSKLEGERYLFLRSLEKMGRIRNLKTQVPFEIIPKQTVTEERVGKNGQPLKPRVKVVEHNVEYIADFTYEFPTGETWTNPHGSEFSVIRHVVEDTKGFKTPDYIIKRKLMRLKGHPITEVKTPTQPIPTRNY